MQEQSQHCPSVCLSVCWQGQSSAKGFQDNTTGDNLKATSQLVSVIYSNQCLAGERDVHYPEQAMAGLS